MRDHRGYPLSIRFWYVVHDQAERLWHWVYRTKIRPWHEQHDAPPVPPSYHFIAEHEPTDDERARGITKRRVYHTC